MVRRRSPQVDLAKEFKKYSRSHAFFYVALDPERALGLEDALPNYTIICPYKSQLTESLHYRSAEKLEYTHDREYILKRVLVLEEHLTSKEVGKIVERGTYGILQSEFVKKHIQKYYDRGKSVYIFVLKNSQLIEDLCKKQGWKLLAPKAAVAEKFENKISQYTLLKDVVSYPRTLISTVKKVCVFDKTGNSFCSTQGGDPFNPPIVLANDSPLKSRKEFPVLSGLKTFVLQFNRGHSGNSTFFLKSKKDLETLYKLYPNRECKVSEHIKGKTYTLNCLVLKNGEVITGSLSEQITGLKSATNNPNTTCGNDFTSPRTLSRKQVGGIQKIAQNVGKALHKKSYRGLFGIDVIIASATGAVYFIELNTHQPASVSFEARLHRKIGKVPLLAYFILDSMGAKPKQDKRDLPPIILPFFAKQIIYRNKTSGVLNRKDVERSYKGKGPISRMKYIKPNEEIFRKQLVK